MRQLLAVLIALMVVGSCPAGTWIPVVIHVHTIFSDGGGTPQEVAAAVLSDLAKSGYDGRCAIVVCDHFDGVARSFESYAAAICAASNGRVIMIPGLEVGSKWHPEPNTEATSHIVALGHVPDNFRTLLDCYDLNTSGSGLPLLDRFGMQQQEINEILALGMMPVAAHPTQLVMGGNLVRRDNRFDKSHCVGILGIEVNNYVGRGQEEECINWFLRLIAEGLLVFVTSGSDYHGTSASAIPDALLGSLDRITWVYADDFSESAILRAISEGKTYAAQKGSFFGGFLRDGGHNPGFEVVGVDSMTITAQAWLTGRDVKTIVYRDGIEAMRQEYKGDLTRQGFYVLNGGDDFQNGWTDAQAKPGSTHRYVVRVTATTRLGEQTLLITSPITLHLRLPGQTAAFFDAIKSGNLAAIDAALVADPSLANARDSRENNLPVHRNHPLALSVACALGTSDTVRRLLDMGATPESHLTAGEPGPMMEAIYRGSIEIIKLLLDHGANINVHTDGNSPLVWAIDRGHTDLAKLLIERGADVNLAGDSGVRPLKRAREHGMEEIARLLLARGAKE